MKHLVENRKLGRTSRRRLHAYVIAQEAVGIIKRLYAIEDRGKTRDAPDRLLLRQTESVPILTALKDKLYAWRDRLLPKRPVAEAVG